MMTVEGIGPTGVGSVRVDGTYGLGPQNRAEETDPKAEALQGQYVGRDAENCAEVVFSQERLIAAAASAEEVNVQAVEEARALLDSGQLDTPEAARRAAEAILKTGL